MEAVQENEKDRRKRGLFHFDHAANLNKFRGKPNRINELQRTTNQENSMESMNYANRQKWKTYWNQ